MPYVTRLIREARAVADEEANEAEFRARLLDALAGDRPVRAAIRALIPAAKQAAPRTSRR
jgi:hypothetical protein